MIFFNHKTKGIDQIFQNFMFKPQLAHYVC